MARRLYVYYRVPDSALPAVPRAVHAMQAWLMQQHPGLQASLLRRPEMHDGEVTLMETYAGGVTPALEAAIHAAAQNLPQPRHSERFDELPATPEETNP